MVITSEYLLLQKKLHENPDYGSASLYYAPFVIEVANRICAQSITDYGAGKRRLLQKMHELGKSDFDYFAYDPVFPEYGKPKKADLVVCIDVLEHVEPSQLNLVMQDLARITTNIGFYTVHTAPAQKFLDDGRNAHLIQKPMSWWLKSLEKFFTIVHKDPSNDGFWLIVKPKSSD